MFVDNIFFFFSFFYESGVYRWVVISPYLLGEILVLSFVFFIFGVGLFRGGSALLVSVYYKLVFFCLVFA